MRGWSLSREISYRVGSSCVSESRMSRCRKRYRGAVGLPKVGEKAVQARNLLAKVAIQSLLCLLSRLIKNVESSVQGFYYGTKQVL